MAEKTTGLSRSLQTRMALGYAVIIVALLVLLNTYPLLMSQNLMFRSQQTALQNQRHQQQRHAADPGLHKGQLYHLAQQHIGNDTRTYQ